jgi:hypothetical protein
MSMSQNLRFEAIIRSDDEFGHQPGAGLMQDLLSVLSNDGWSADEMENWRNSGWSTRCRRSSAEMEMVLVQIETGQWLLQISAWSRPGLIGRIFGRKVSAKRGDVHELALAVHRALAALHCLGSPRWRWDGFPDDACSTSEPMAEPQEHPPRRRGADASGTPSDGDQYRPHQGTRLRARRRP